MTKGRKVDPTRVDRHTGHRALPGEQKPPELPPTAAIVESALAAPPAWIPAPAHDIWHRAVDELIALRTVHESDLPLIEQLVFAAYIYRRAAMELEAMSLTGFSAMGNEVANPRLKIMKDAASTYDQKAEKLGLTPVARLRMGLMRIAGETMLQGLNNELATAVAARLAAGK